MVLQTKAPKKIKELINDFKPILLLETLIFAGTL
jgi:hypothetical protein